MYVGTRGVRGPSDKKRGKTYVMGGPGRGREPTVTSPGRGKEPYEIVWKRRKESGGCGGRIGVRVEYYIGRQSDSFICGCLFYEDGRRTGV